MVRWPKQKDRDGSGEGERAGDAKQKLLAFVFAQTKVGDRAADAGRHQIGRRVVMMMMGVVFDLVQRDQLVVEGVGRFHFHRRHWHDAHGSSAAHLCR